MVKNKLFMILIILYTIFFSFVVGLIIHKFTSAPTQYTSPTVSFNSDNSLDVSEKLTPENLVDQIYEWMQLDSERSKSIIIDGIPTISSSQQLPENQWRFWDFIIEPKDWIKNCIDWVFGINFGKPETYLSTSIPQLDSSQEIVEVIAVQSKNSEYNKLINDNNREPRVIKSEAGTIYLNIPKEEMIFKPITPEVDVAFREENKVEKNSLVEIVNRKPRVLIYHTHTSETYADDKYPKDNLWHTYLPHLGNIVIVGETLSTRLQELGFEVCHDQTSYDGKEFHLAYDNSRKGIQNILEKECFDMVIDIHRDGVELPKEEYVMNIKGKPAAKVLFFVTKGQVDYSTAGGHDWKTNYSLCSALVEKIQEKYPGLLRRVMIRENKRYNQDLHPQALLFEVGCQKNTTAEAVYSAQLLAEVIAELFKEQPVFLLD